MGGMHIMVDHGLTERLLEKRGVLESLSGFAQRIGNFLEFHGAISVADEGFFKFQLLVYSFQTCGDKRCKGEIRIEIGTADAALDANALRAFAAQAKPCGTIILAPHDLRWRKSASLKTLVGIDIGRQEIGVIGGIFELPSYP